MMVRGRNRPPQSDVATKFFLICVLVVLIFFLLEIIKILLPWLMLGGVVALGWWLWRRRQLEIRRRQQVFYGLLQTHQGRVSVLDFAIAANLSAHESKVFLDHRAEEFLANFEVTEKGDMLYVFNSHFMGKKVA